jgi:HTH-type transcriptional regulator / antitoxin HigA
MTLTINPSDYAQLLAFYQSKVIETETEARSLLIESAQELEHKANRSNEEDAIIVIPIFKTS